MVKKQRKFYTKKQSFQPVDLDLTVSGHAVIINYLFRWSASIYRLVWIDIVVWLVLYYILNLVYRLALNKTQQAIFENLVEQVGEWSAKIPVTFLLGFFVSNVVSRWWTLFHAIPRMTGPAAVLVSGIRGKEGARFRTEIGRYLNLAWVLALWDFCGGLQRRFSIIKEVAIEEEGEIVLNNDGTLHVVPEPRDSSSDSDFSQLLRECVLPHNGPLAESLQKLALLNADPLVRKHCGRIITRSEFAVFVQRAKQAKTLYNPEWYIPIYWALELTQQALKAGCIADTYMLQSVQNEIQAWSGKIRTLANYAKRQLPLVYIQVVMVAVYTIYITEVLSRQMLHPAFALERKSKGYYVDYFVPVLAIAHIMFILGWFKVALVLLDPFGTDEEDFAFSEIFTNNLKVVSQQCPSDKSHYPSSLGGETGAEITSVAAAAAAVEMEAQKLDLTAAKVEPVKTKEFSSAETD